MRVLQDAVRGRLPEQRRDRRIVVEGQNPRALQVRRKQIFVAEPELPAGVTGPSPEGMAVEAMHGDNTKIGRQEVPTMGLLELTPPRGPRLCILR